MFQNIEVRYEVSFNIQFSDVFVFVILYSIHNLLSYGLELHVEMSGMNARLPRVPIQ